MSSPSDPPRPAPARIAARRAWPAWWWWPWRWAGSLRGATLLFGLSVLGERVIGLVILAMLTRLLPPDTYGLWTQMVAAAAMVSAVLLLGFNATLVSLLAEAESRSDASGLFHGMLVATSAVSFAFVAITYVFAASVSTVVFGSATYGPFAGLLGLLVFSDTLVDLTAMVLRARQQIALASGYYLIRTLFRLVVFALALVIGRLGFRDAVVGIVLGQLALVVLVYVVRIRRDLGPNPGLKAFPWRRVLGLSLPFVPYYAVVALNGFVPRFFLAQFAVLTDVAIFSVAYTLLAAVAIIYSVMGFTLYPHLAARWTRGDTVAVAESLGRFAMYFLFFGAPIVVLISILGRPLTLLLTTEAYVSGWPVLLTAGLGTVVFGLYQLHIYIPILAGKTLANLLLMTGAFLANAVLCRLLVPAYDVLGAATASLGASAILAAGTVVLAQRHSPYRFPWQAAGRIIGAGLVMAAVGIAILSGGRSSELHWIILSAVAAMVVYAAIDTAHRGSLLRQLL